MGLVDVVVLLVDNLLEIVFEVEFGLNVFVFFMLLCVNVILVYSGLLLLVGFVNVVRLGVCIFIF